jgi:hypothetical protein
MRCAASSPAARCGASLAAALAAVAVLAGCTGGGGHPPAGAQRRTEGSGGGVHALVVLPSTDGGPDAVVGISSSAGSRPRISVPRIAPASSASSITMPLDAYEQISIQQQGILNDAVVLLTQQCMAARGFVYTAQAQGSDSLASIQEIENTGLGLTSLTQAQTYGYRTSQSHSGQLSTGPVGSAAEPNLGSAIKQHGTGWADALDRPGRGSSAGCLVIALSQLEGPGQTDLAVGLAYQAEQWTRTDPRLGAASQAWSRCMARRGLTYSSPLAAAQHRWPKLPSRTEIATAIADVTCKTQANLVNTWQTVNAAYQQALVNRNPIQLAEAQASFASALRRAENLLAGRA